MINLRHFQLADYIDVMRLCEECADEVQREEIKTSFAHCLRFDSALVLLSEEQHQVTGLCIGHYETFRGGIVHLLVREGSRPETVDQLTEAMHQQFRNRGVIDITSLS